MKRSGWTVVVIGALVGVIGMIGTAIGALLALALMGQL